MGRSWVAAFAIVGALVALWGCGEVTTEYYLGADELSEEQAIGLRTVPVDETVDPVRSAIKTGISTQTAVRDRLKGRDIVVANGSYYEVNTTVLAELNATRVAYRVTVVSGETPTLSIETLSRRDWRRPGLACLLADEVGDEHTESALYTNETELGQSALADQTVTVEANGTLYEIEPGAREAAKKEVYQYTTRRVTTSNASYLGYIDERFTVSLSDASADARSAFGQLLSRQAANTRPGTD